ncbi:MAG: hypothetical protein ACOVRN_11605 [Flavobacterium sp.]
MNYERFCFEDKEVVIFLLNSGEQQKIVSAIVGAINGIEDRQWLEDICMGYIHHNDYWIAKAALNGLGDIARIYKTINLEKLNKEITKISNDALKPVINDLKTDLKMFLGNQIFDNY